MKNNQRIEFPKDSIVTYQVKQMDRILVDGPVEIEFSTIRVSGSLDYQILVTLSMPSGTKITKINPQTMGEMLEKQNRESRSKLN